MFCKSRCWTFDKELKIFSPKRQLSMFLTAKDMATHCNAVRRRQRLHAYWQRWTCRGFLSTPVITDESAVVLSLGEGRRWLFWILTKLFHNCKYATFPESLSINFRHFSFFVLSCTHFSIQFVNFEFNLGMKRVLNTVNNDILSIQLQTFSGPSDHILEYRTVHCSMTVQTWWPMNHLQWMSHINEIIGLRLYQDASCCWGGNRWTDGEWTHLTASRANSCTIRGGVYSSDAGNEKLWGKLKQLLNSTSA